MVTALSVLEAPELRADTLEERLGDPAWVAAEFVAIMTASGIPRDAAVTTCAACPPPSPVRPARPDAWRTGPAVSPRAPAPSARARVRSPPTTA